MPREMALGTHTPRPSRNQLLPRVLRSVETFPPNPRQLSFLWTSIATIEPVYPPTRRHLSKTGFGAGFTPEDAQARAIGEVLELYAARRCRDEDLIHCSLSELHDDCLDPRQLCLYGSSQYRDPHFPFVRFTTRTRIAWTRGHWLDTREVVWLPAFMTYFGARVSLDQNLSEVTTNGLATGTSKREAVTRALLELVERDAFMISWLAQQPALRILPDKSLDRGTRLLITKMEAHHLSPRFYLLNAGVDIPVVLCVVRGNGKDWPGATIGLGAHGDAAAAMRKATLEQAFIGPALRREMLRGRYPIPTRANQVRTPLDHALYYASPSRARALNFLESKCAPVPLSAVSQPRDTSLTSYLRILSAAGIRIAVKDLTPPAIAESTCFRIVRALGPQLQPLHFGAEFARDACRRLRQLSRPSNPRPHPLA